METLTEYLKANVPKGFFPKPIYSADGDSLTFYFKNEESYAERVDDFLTVYRSIDNDGLIGCQIKGLPATLKLMGDFGLHITDGKVQLSMLFLTCMAHTNEPEAKDCYRKLNEKAGKTLAELPQHLFETAVAR